MYWILFVMGAVAAVVIAVLVGGLVTPRVQRVARTMRLDAPADAVWARVRAVEHFADWRSELEDVDIEASPPGQLRWTERSTTGSAAFEMSRDDAPHRFGIRSREVDVAASNEWTWHVLGDGDHARVTLAARIDIPNPLSRFVSTHLIGHGKPIERRLRDLARSFGSLHPDIKATDAPD